MRYFKILEDETLLTAEAHEAPAFVMYQEKNRILVRCSEHYAQGIISLDASEVYQLPEKEQLPDIDKVAVEISKAEYDQIVTEDPEDDNPEIPADDPEAEVLTRAQLTARIHALEDELAAAKILMGVSDE